jgi:hypothetical protein
VLDPYPDLARTADTGGVHNLDFAAFVFNDGAVDISGRSGDIGDNRLLFFGTRVKQV